MDIVTIKELLGHERIETTLVYLHVAKPNRSNLFSPLDRLYKNPEVAISNHRLLKVDETGVRFRWRDYRDNTQKVMALDGAEFLRRFCQHILPRGFVRIRHYGLLSTARRMQLRELQLSFGIKVLVVKEKKHWKDICRDRLNFNPDICPICGKGHMITVETFLNPRPPPLSPAD